MSPASRFALAALAALALIPATAAPAATWESVGYGVIDGSGIVTSVALDSAGGVIATGEFENPCTGPGDLQATPSWCPNTNISQNSPFTGVARWSGSEWSSLGSGFRGYLAPYGRDVQRGPDGRIYVGGTFDQAGSDTAASLLAVWNGSTWSSLGTGFLPLNAPGAVNAIAFGPAGDLYVGGRFDSASAQSAQNVAKWDGTRWSPLGAGLDDAAVALATAPNGTLYASGNFGVYGTWWGVAQWDGTSWSSVGDGQFGSWWPETLAVDQRGVLYAGGRFSTPANGIVRWDGNAWSALGSGLSSGAVVGDIAIDHDGGVYVGGMALLPASGAPNVAQVAKWDGNTWSLLATAATDSLVGAAGVRGVTVDPTGYLYAAGSFRVVDGQLTGQIARTVIATPPGAPTDVAARAGDTSAEVSWTAPARNGAGTITGYAVTSEPDGRTCTWTSGPLRCTVTGLRKGTRYTFSVKAVNMAGEGAAGSAAATTTTEAASAASSITPRITRLVPARGPVRGGTRVQVRGSDLAGAMRVTFGGVRARIIRRSSDRVVVVAPAHARGRVAVTVTAGTARDTKRRAYRYVAPASRRVPAVTG